MPDKEIGSHAPAVLFDVDGTLVDSNYLHIHAWQRAFAEVGIDVETWRIHRSIGMDGSALVRSLSDDAPGETQKRLKDLHSHIYAEMGSLQGGAGHSDPLRPSGD